MKLSTFFSYFLLNFGTLFLSVQTQPSNNYNFKKQVRPEDGAYSYSIANLSQLNQFECLNRCNQNDQCFSVTYDAQMTCSLFKKVIQPTGIISNQVDIYAKQFVTLTSPMVTTAVFSLSNGDLILGTNSGMIRVWDTKSWFLKTEFNTHSNCIAAFADLTNGDVASGSFDYTVKIWNSASWTLKYTLTQHVGAIWSLATLLNGDLASASADQTIKIWNTTTGTEKMTLSGHADAVRCLSVLKNGDLASGSWDYTVKIWNSITGSLKTTLYGHRYKLTSLATLTNGDLMSGAWDQSIIIWDVVNYSLKRKISTSNPNSFVALPNNHVANAGTDSKIWIYDGVDGTLSKLLTGHTSGLLASSLMQNGYLASSADDGTVKIWNVDAY